MSRPRRSTTTPASGPTKIWLRSNAPSAASRPSTFTSVRSSTGRPRACVPTSACACSPITSNGTCADASPRCSTMMLRKSSPRPCDQASLPRPSARHQPSPNKPQEPLPTVCPSTASDPCSPTWRRWQKIPSSPRSIPTTSSPSTPGQPSFSRRHSTSSASTPAPGLQGDDTIGSTVSLNNSSLYGGQGNDVIYGNNHNVVYGQTGNDFLEVNGDPFYGYYGNNNTLYGGQGNDTIEINSFGNSGTGNVAYGGAGSNYIYAYNQIADTLVGGT